MRFEERPEWVQTLLVLGGWIAAFAVLLLLMAACEQILGP